MQATVEYSQLSWMGTLGHWAEGRACSQGILSRLPGPV